MDRKHEWTRPRELKAVEFTDPVCWCESTGRFINADGQELELRVRGMNTDVVEQYIREVRVDFEVIPMDRALPEEVDPASPDVDQADPVTEEEIQGMMDDPESELEIALEVIETQGIEPPFVLRAAIDPTIGRTKHRYVTTGSYTIVTASLTAKQNGISCGIYRGSSWANAQFIHGDRADTDPGQPDEFAYLAGSARAATKYYVAVTGRDASNSYQISTSVTMVRF